MRTMSNDVVKNPSTEWVKTTIAEPMAKMAREAGVTPHGEAIDAEVQRMIARHDAEEREHGGHTPRVPVKRGRDAAAVVAKELGATFVRDDSLRKPAPKIEPMSPWVVKLRARIRVLVSKVPGTTWRERVARFPKYRENYLTEFMTYQTRSGRYKFASDADAQKMLSRFTEDMADRSAAFLGGWR